MSLKEFAGQLPDFAKDIRLNVGSLLNEPVLNDQRKYGLLLACAHGTGHKPLVDAAEAECAPKLSPEAANAARAAAAVMAMNNVYYASPTGGEPGISQHARQAAHERDRRTGIDKIDFELFSLAVSAINGCGMCIDAHEAVLKKAGASAEIIQTAVRIAAVMQAVATVHSAIA